VAEATAGTSSQQAAASRIVVVIRYVIYVGLPVHLALLTVFALTGVRTMALFNIWSVAMWIGAWVANSRGRGWLSAQLLIIEVAAHAVAAVAILGLGSGFQYYLVPIIAFTLFNDQASPRMAITSSAVIVLLFVGMRFLFAGVVMHPGWAPLGGPAEYINMATALAFVVVICIYFRFASIDVERRMEELAASLERRVQEQVAEIVARANEVQSLNAQLQAQVKARSEELVQVLSRLSQQPDAGGLARGSVLDGRFEVAEPIGAGGMGLVYAGKDRTSGRKVAIKVVRARSGGDIEPLRRFVREAGAAATVQHPAVVRMIHVGVSDDGLLYQVQELVDGIELSRCIGLSWAPADAARLGAVLFEALAAAHSSGVVHRDVKAENLMLTAAAPGLKLLDFGIAKLYDAAAGGTGTMTHAGNMVGTPAFMAPEQASGDPNVGDRADVYAGGTLLYLMIAGRLPYERGAGSSWFFKRLVEDAEDLRAHAPATPEPLARLVMACLARGAAERPSAAALATELGAFAEKNGGRKLEALFAEMESVASRTFDHAPTVGHNTAVASPAARAQTPAAAAGSDNR
jgi:hypothetical protein